MVVSALGRRHFNKGGSCQNNQVWANSWITVERGERSRESSTVRVTFSRLLTYCHIFIAFCVCKKPHFSMASHTFPPSFLSFVLSPVLPFSLPSTSCVLVLGCVCVCVCVLVVLVALLPDVMSAPGNKVDIKQFFLL